MSFISGFKAAILICSDRCARGESQDGTSQRLKDQLDVLGIETVEIAVVPDEIDVIINKLKDWIHSQTVHLVLTSGGTGLSPGDVTPEATLQVIERRIPGMEEAMRTASMKITPNAMLSRSVAGTAGSTLIVNLPGSPSGAVENFNVIAPALEHALRLIAGERVDP